MLGRRDPVGVDGGHVPGVGLPAPADQELRRGILAGVHVAFRDRGHVTAARRLGDERERSRGDPREVVAGLVDPDVDELAEAQLRPERREPRLQVRHRVPARILQLDRLRPRHPGSERAVDEEAPDLLERMASDKLFDVDAAVPERRTLAVRLGDLRLERDDPLEPRAEVVHAGTLARTRAPNQGRGEFGGRT